MRKRLFFVGYTFSMAHFVNGEWKSLTCKIIRMEHGRALYDIEDIPDGYRHIGDVSLDVLNTIVVKES